MGRKDNFEMGSNKNPGPFGGTGVSVYVHQRRSRDQAALFSSFTAHTLNSGMPHTGSSAALVSLLAAAWA